MGSPVRSHHCPRWASVGRLVQAGERQVTTTRRRHRLRPHKSHREIGGFRCNTQVTAGLTTRSTDIHPPATPSRCLARSPVAGPAWAKERGRTEVSRSPGAEQDAQATWLGRRSREERSRDAGAADDPCDGADHRLIDKQATWRHWLQIHPPHLRELGTSPPPRYTTHRAGPQEVRHLKAADDPQAPWTKNHGEKRQIPQTNESDARKGCPDAAACTAMPLCPRQPLL